MFKTSYDQRPRAPQNQLDLSERDSNRARIGLPGLFWVGLSLVIILATFLMMLVLDGRTVVHAAERKDYPWGSAWESGDWATVQKLAKAEVTKNSRNAVAQNALGVALLEQGKLDEAEYPLITAESLEPGVVGYKVALANLYSKKGVPQLAAGKLREAVDLDPSLAHLHWRLARLLYLLGQPEESLAELRVINQLEPDNWDAYRLTAEVAMGRRVAQNDREAVNTKYREAIRNLKLYTAIVPDARSWAKLAFAYMSLQPPDTAAARSAALRSLSIDPGDSQAHLALARINLISNQPDAAVQQYLQAASFYLPSRDLAFMAKIQTARKRPGDAEVYLRTAAAIDTTNKDYLYDLGSNLVAQQKYDDAREVFNQYIILDPSNPSVLANLGNLEMQSGDPDAAERTYQKALDVKEDYAPALVGMGDIYSARGATTQAASAYDRAIKSGPDPGTESDARGKLGYMLWQQGRFNEAIPILDSPVVFQQCNVHAILTLANCYQKVGQTPQGVGILKKGLLCAPNDPQIREAARAAAGGP